MSIMSYKFIEINCLSKIIKTGVEYYYNYNAPKFRKQCLDVTYIRFKKHSLLRNSYNTLPSHLLQNLFPANYRKTKKTRNFEASQRRGSDCGPDDRR